MTTMHRRWGGLVVLVAGAAIGLAACSGSSSPHVASLGKNSGDGSVSTTTMPAGSPTQLLDEWATCMRSHGDPAQVDPTVDATKVIQITLDANMGLRGENGACGSYLSAAQTALGGGTPPASSDEATASEVRPVHAGQRRPDLSRPDDRQQSDHPRKHVGVT